MHIMKHPFQLAPARAWAAGASLAVLALLSACGSSSIDSALKPARFVSFGDAMSDVGNTPLPGASVASGLRFTVNDGNATPTWVEYMVSRYSQTLSRSSAGGTGYAMGNARVLAKPDAAGSTSTATVKEQIDAFLRTGSIGANDVLVINAGQSDIVAEYAAMQAGRQTETQMMANLQQAGRDLGAQTRRLVDAGAKYVMVAGAYNMGKSPWAIALGKQTLLTDASSRFNEAFLVAVNDLGAQVLYVDTAYFYNLVTSVPASYSLTNGDKVACNSVDATNAQGIGSGQVNALLCTAATIVSGVDHNTYTFADPINFTPAAHKQFGTWAYDRLRQRW